MYILVSCYEGYITVDKFNAYDDAYARMEEEYNEFVESCEEHGFYSISDYNAFVAYELDSRCDWHIEKI